MTIIQDQIENIINNANKTGDTMFIFGNLQDTPDNSKNFTMAHLESQNIH